MKTFELPYGMTINDYGSGICKVVTSCKQGGESPELNAALDAVESLTLACACAGIDVVSKAFTEAFETAIDAIEREYGDD